MAINPNLFIAAPMLQDYFVDKDTGYPLAAGIITFYEDDARSFLKNIYYQTGSPGSYTYIPLPNPLTLSSVGTIQDGNGNDVIPFFYPYDEEDEDISQPYYITVFSNLNIEQFTRENFPFVPGDINPDIGQQDLINYIPNPQFAAHRDLPNNGLYPNGDTSVVIAQGGSVGWYFKKSNSSTDTDYINFNLINQEPEGLEGNPKFSLNLSCIQTAETDDEKTLRVRFNNVNRFASDTQLYTFSLSGINNNSGSVNIDFQLYKFFGSTGSSPVTTTEQTFTLVNTGYTQFSTSFLFGNNNAYTISGGDDYFELVISVPAISLYDIAVTDFILTPGEIDITNFPEQPDNMVFANGIAGSSPTPAFDGSDFYLPLIWTPAGLNVDRSVIGNIIANVGTVSNKLLCDGSGYVTSDYSSLGIPYSRLQQYLLSLGDQNVPLFGTGAIYFTAYINNSINNYLRLTTNQDGAESPATDGVSATNFTFSTIHTGQKTFVKAYSSGTNTILGINLAAGSVTNANANNSGFTVNQIVNNSLSYGKFTVETIAASSMTAGHYFTFSGLAIGYYCWFKINGVGSDPSPGGTGIQVNLLSTYSAQEVANCIREAISGFEVSLIQCNAANTLTGGNYFTFTADGDTYSVWYSIDGVGNDPHIGVSIEVSLDGTETNAEVALKTQQAINSYSFAVPDLRGTFLRGIKDTGQFDIEADSRYSYITGYWGNNPGTFENDTNQSHTHIASGTVVVKGSDVSVASNFQPFMGGENDQDTTAQPPPLDLSISIDNTGNAESQPQNSYVNWYIVY